MIDFRTTKELAFRLSRAQCNLDALCIFEETSSILFQHILFVATRFDFEERVMTQMFSNLRDSTVGGTKAISSKGAWVRRLIVERRAYVGYTKEDLREIFTDYQMLWEIGCGSAMSVPVVWRNRTVGSFSILGREKQYGESHASAMGILAQAAVPLFLRNTPISVKENVKLR